VLEKGSRKIGAESPALVNQKSQNGGKYLRNKTFSFTKGRNAKDKDWNAKACCARLVKEEGKKTGNPVNFTFKRGRTTISKGRVKRLLWVGSISQVKGAGGAIFSNAWFLGGRK